MVLEHLYEEPVTAACFERAGLRAGDRVEGPAIVWEENSTTFVPLGRSATVGAFGQIEVT